jgi:four helix bundle protein
MNWDFRAHALSLTLPNFERFEEGGQLRRSSKSVSSRIVEGHALRRYRSDYARYLWRAYGSAEETIEHLRYLTETGSLNDKRQGDELREGYARLATKIFNYILSVEQGHDTQFYVKEEQAGYKVERDEG